MRGTARIATVATNTVREAIRNRVLYTLLFFAILLIGTGVVVSTLSYTERGRIIQDVGLAAIRLFSVAIAVFVGVSLIYKEVDRRTIYTILSKPVSRTEFLLGKYAGLVATIWLQVAIMASAFAVISLLTGAPLDAGHAAALLLVAWELAFLVAVATLFSSFTSPMLASFFTMSIFLIGHFTRNLRALGDQSEVEALRRTTALLHRVLPDLESFNLSLQAVHRLPIAACDVWLPLVYGACYTALVLLVAAVVFERRDFR
jgi:ABC-type transport system involved in multi-copper enzyme maturation permease subunit